MAVRKSTMVSYYVSIVTDIIADYLRPYKRHCSVTIVTWSLQSAVIVLQQYPVSMSKSQDMIVIMMSSAILYTCLVTCSGISRTC